MTSLVAAGTGKVHYGLEKTTEGASAVKNDSDAFYSLLNFGHYAFMGIEYACGNSTPVTYTMQRISGGITVMDVFDIFPVLNYWTSGEFIDDWREGKPFQVFASASLGTATYCGFTSWLGELGAIDLGAISSRLGSIPVVGGIFGTLAQVGLGLITLGATAVGYAFLAANAIHNIIKADNGKKTVKGILDLFSSATYVALYISLMITGVCVLAIAILGCVASGIGISSFLLKHYNEEAFKKKTQLKEV